MNHRADIADNAVDATVIAVDVAPAVSAVAINAIIMLLLIVCILLPVL